MALERVLGAVDPRLDVGRARGRDEQRDLAAVGEQLDDVLAHLLAGDEQVLADVGQAAGLRLVGVVGDDRDPGGERLLDRGVERGREISVVAMPLAFED